MLTKTELLQKLEYFPAMQFFQPVKKNVNGFRK